MMTTTANLTGIVSDDALTIVQDPDRAVVGLEHVDTQALAAGLALAALFATGVGTGIAFYSATH